MHHVLIVGGAKEPEVVRTVQEVRMRGAKPIVCDSSAFPQDLLVSFQDGGIRLGRCVLPDIDSVYLRNLNSQPLAPPLEEDFDSRPRGVLAQCNEKRAMLASLVQVLDRNGVPIINTLEVNAQHSQKPYQLELLRRKRLPVPRFLATNDPRVARRFIQEVKRAVYKPLAGGATVREVTQADVSDERLATLANAPVLFQELVDGTPVRAYVAGQRVVGAAEIHSPELDYRRREEEVTATALSPLEQKATLAAARTCRMTFAGVDLIRTDTGFVVLECNPSPMFGVFETKTGLNIARALAALLTGSPKFQAQ